MTADQLRKSILQQAIQGKLVPQDPNDEPASVLLERIREEKARLVKEKKIKKEKNPSIIFRGEDNSHYEKFILTGEVKCIDDEIPFDLPKGWEWCRLGEVAEYRKGPFGSSLTKSMFVPFSSTSIKVYEQKNAIQKDFSLGEYYITEEKFNEMIAFRVLPNDIIVSCAGTIGETYILPMNAPFGIINQALMRVSLFEQGMSEYWRWLFKYVMVRDSLMKGAGSAIKNIPPFEYLKNILIPLPPLSEQQRIVTKIEELIPLVEQYGKAQSELEALNSNIREQLKKSVLQYAIEGKLVPQCEEDGTAEDLLQEIQAEKQRLYTEGKLKKKDLTPSTIFRGEDNKYFEKKGEEFICIDEEIPFDIPDSWEWVRLGCISKFSIGKTPERGNSRYWENGVYPWVSISDMKPNEYIHSTREKVSQDAVDKCFGDISPKGSLLMSFKLTIGRTSILQMESYHNEAIVTLTPFIDLNYTLRNYLFYILPVTSNMGESNDAIKGKTLNSKSLFNILIPLPPLIEQQKIIHKIEVVASIMSR